MYCTYSTYFALSCHCPIIFWPIFLRVSFWVWSKPDTQRQATQHDYLPRCLAMGANKVKKCAVWKIIFYTGLTTAAKAGRKSIAPAWWAQRTNQGRAPFIRAPRVPICLSFNSQQGLLLSGISGQITNPDGQAIQAVKLQQMNLPSSGLCYECYTAN